MSGIWYQINLKHIPHTRTSPLALLYSTIKGITSIMDLPLSVSIIFARVYEYSMGISRREKLGDRATLNKRCRETALAPLDRQQRRLEMP